MSQRAGHGGLKTSCKSHRMGFVLFQRRRAGRVQRDNIHGAWQINVQDFVILSVSFGLLESSIQRGLQMIKCKETHFQPEFHSPLNESDFFPFRKITPTHHLPCLRLLPLLQL